jgi:phytoene dehydrogenase-like protein
LAHTEILIIGAGHNGLVCAYYLASRGLKVTILERRHVVGGAAVTENSTRLPQFDASYTVSLLNPQVIEDMRLYEHGSKSCSARLTISFPLRDPIICWRAAEGLTRREIARHSPEDARPTTTMHGRLKAVVRILRVWLLAPRQRGRRDRRHPRASESGSRRRPAEP